MNSPVYNLRPQRQSAIPNVIFVLLIANGLLYALQNFQPEFIETNFALWSLHTQRFMPWQLLTYGFLHARGDLMHIIFNMLMLWMFGRDLEYSMGAKRFLTYYLVCVVGAGLVQLLVGSLGGGFGVTLGASGGVFGILLAYGLAYPNRMIMMMFPPIPMKAKYFVILLGLFELYLGFSGRSPGVANFAHLGGMLFGFGLLRYWRGNARR